MHPQFHKLGLFPRQLQHLPVSLYDYICKTKWRSKGWWARKMPGRPVVWNRHVHDDVETLMSPPHCKTGDIVASTIKHIVAFIVVYFHFLTFWRFYNLFSELWLNCSNNWIKQIWVVFKTKSKLGDIFGLDSKMLDLGCTVRHFLVINDSLWYNSDSIRCLVWPIHTQVY